MPRIRDMGHDIAISAYYGIQGSMLRWNGIDVYPSYSGMYGVDTIVPHAIDHFGGDDLGSFHEAVSSGLIITLTDVWVLQAPLLCDMAVASWTPIDHLSVPAIVAKWYNETRAIPIAMSRFGEKALTDAGYKPLYVPHSIDTGCYSPSDRTEARERAGLPEDAFVVAMVAANVGADGSRKAFSEQIAAFAEFRRRHSDAILALHTDIDSGGGMQLRTLLSQLPEGSWTCSDQYAYRKGMPAGAVADIYRSADVLSNCSWGEGFGIPIVESQACGTPVIVTDATAMPELCGAGWKVPYEPIWHESQGAWAARPIIGEITDAYEQAYEHAASMRDQARVFAESYDADLVADTYWRPVLKQLGEGLERRMEDAHTPRHRRPTPDIVPADGLLWIDRGKGTEDYLGPSSHESELEPIIAGLIPDDGTGIVLDVGAHVGHWTLRLAEHAALILAVEANPSTASVLRRNLALNDIGNVEVLNFAAWDEETSLRLEDPNRHTDGGSTRTLPGGGGVPGVRLDDIVDVPRLDLVKLDVEGADLHALRGMTGLFDRHQPVLFIECHDYAGYYTRADLEATLTELGYTWKVAFTYQTRWSPDGLLDEPVDADYLVCTPITETDRIARDACGKHGASQRADELADALALVAGIDPRVIVEIGCDLGGTLYAWRQLYDRVYGITLADNSYATGGRDGDLDSHGAVVHIGDSHDRSSLDWLVRELRGDPVDVLVLDGDHSVDGVHTDLAMYGPLVRPGGMILLHDIASVGDPRAEVWKVWPGLRDRYSTTEIRSPGISFGWGAIYVGPDGFIWEG